jgi:SAM-dependent methyltransferase
MTVHAMATVGKERTQYDAADLAGVAVLLEIGDQLGISHLLDAGKPITVAVLAEAASIPADAAAAYAHALLAAGLLTPANGPEQFVPCAEIADWRYAAGYVSWALSANRAFIDHAPEFLRDPGGAATAYRRNARQVAVSSGWIGSRGFYPSGIAAISAGRCNRVADLGAGAAKLLIRLLQEGIAKSAVALDISAEACEEAERAARHSGVSDRLEVVHRSIESLADDAGPVAGVDVVHAGFVLHDIVGRPDVLGSVLASCRCALANEGRLVVTDAVPYAPDEPERRFSALFSYLHAKFMDVALPTEEEWLAAFRGAGFSEVSCTPHAFPSGRLFVASM